MAPQLPLTLCMIVKNEERNLPKCLKSLKNLISEIVVVDTGSTDRTKKIAEAYGAKIYSLSWPGSFAEARNFALTKASTKWVLILDADEELVVTDPSILQDILEEKDKPGYLIPTLNYTGELKCPIIETSLGLRIFKSTYRYEGPIHEQVNLPSHKSPEILAKGIYINHFGYLNSKTKEASKVTRNISTLKQCLAINPKDSFALFYLGNEYLRLDSYEKALECYYNAKIDPALVTFYSPLIKNTVSCLIELGKTKEALNWIDEGAKHYPSFTDLYYLKGQVRHQQQNYPEALKYFRKCLELGEAPVIFTSTKGVGSFKALYSLGRVYEEIMEPQKAEAAYLESIRNNSFYYYPIYNLIHLQLKQKPKFLSKFLETNFDLEDEKTLHIIVDILREFDQYKSIILLISGMDLRKLSNSLKFKLAISYFYNENPIKALKTFSKIPVHTKWFSSSLRYRFLCRIKLKQNCRAYEELIMLKKSSKVELPMVNFFVFLLDEGMEQCEILKKPKITLECGILLLKDLLIVKLKDKAAKLTALLNRLNPRPSFTVELAQLYFRYNYKAEAFSLISKALKDEFLDKNLLLILKDLIKEEAFLHNFQELLKDWKTKQQDDFYKLLLAKQLYGEALNILATGTRINPASELLQNKLEVFEENFLKL